MEVRAAAEWRDLEGAKRVPRSFDTVARIRVNDPDREKAARVARGIADSLETDWAREHIGEARIVTESTEIDVLLVLADPA